MLRSAEPLYRMAIHATDGDLGRVTEFYFDDATWTIRYLIVRTGSFLSGRDVLLTPAVVHTVDWEGEQVRVNLTMAQVENSPDVSTDRPVSRLQEVEYLRYYEQPPYWVLGAEVGGTGVALDAAMRAAATEAEAAGEAPPTHLRSSREVIGYHIEASDGPIGHVRDFVIDDATWRVKYLVVDPSRWKFNDEVVIAPEWVDRVSWGGRCIHVDLTRDTIRTCPVFGSVAAITPEYERRLAAHYGKRA
jgi:sporulation protein YlmC with PRC-barrel domain